MVSKRHILGLGELLWDMFPDRRCLGGAPANVAYHATQLGDRGALLTRVGADALGDEAVATLSARGVDLRGLQRDPDRPTGTVTVTVGGADGDARGEVAFAIEPDTAWAYPAWSDDWEALLGAADGLCFGTLLCAFPAGRAVLERAAQAAPAAALRLLDLNLRPPFDTDAAIDAALSCANVIKLSEDEAHRLAERSGTAERGGAGPHSRTPDAVAAVAKHLLDRGDVRAVAVTFGSRGSALYTADGCTREPGVALQPGSTADPVGAGDAFTAALMHHLVRAHTPARACAAANRYGAFVASCAGAMPAIPDAIRADVCA